MAFDRISLRRLVLIRWVAIAGQAVTLANTGSSALPIRGSPVAGSTAAHFTPRNHRGRPQAAGPAIKLPRSSTLMPASG